MAVFEEAAATTVATVADLVGEGKKYKTVDDLAKSRLEADMFIETLKGEKAAESAEVARLKAELAARISVEDQIKALTPKPVTIAAPAQTERVEDKPDLSKAVRDEVERLTRSQQLASNVEVVANKLVEVYGSEEKAKEVINQKAKELNVSIKFLMDSAAASPAAFYATVGLTAQRGSVSAPKGDINTEAFRLNPSTIAPGSHEEFRNKYAGNDVSKLLDPAYLNASMKAALANPDKYFANTVD